jgi:hypothetical protein
VTGVAPAPGAIEEESVAFEEIADEVNDRALPEAEFDQHRNAILHPQDRLNIHTARKEGCPQGGVGLIAANTQPIHSF